MLNYLEKKAKEEGLEIETIQTDMTDFRLEKKVDFAFIMMGSLDVESNEKFLSHLDSVAASLNEGGLYLIQNKILDWTKVGEESWTMGKNGITVETTFEIRFKNVLNQIYTEEVTLEVDDHGNRKKFVQEEDLKFIFPQEFKMLIKVNGKFEFIGWWKGNCNTWHLDKPLEKVKNLSDNLILLRRK